MVVMRLRDIVVLPCLDALAIPKLALAVRVENEPASTMEIEIARGTNDDVPGGCELDHRAGAMDEPAFPGCLLKCRLIGIIQGEQGDKKDKERNDRIVAVEKENHSFADIKHIDDLGKQFVRELEEFFVNYHKLSGEQYHIIDVSGPRQARKRIEDGVRAARRG